MTIKSADLFINKKSAFTFPYILNEYLNRKKLVKSTMFVEKMTGMSSCTGFMTFVEITGEILKTGCTTGIQYKHVTLWGG